MGYTELVKHMRYKTMYRENEIYWGIGLEEETYLQFTKPIHVSAPILRNCHGAERYSVKYYSTYYPTYKKDFAKMFTDISGFYALPYFFNSHAFTKMDIHGNHATTYEKQPKPNPAFKGITFFELLEKDSSILSGCSGCFPCCSPKKETFIEIFNKNCIFDGDSIEFMTQNFYKANINDVIKELIDSKKKFLESLNNFLITNKIFRDKGLLMYPTVNPGFAIFYSNPKNVTMFNNGTYHINITLPTVLGKADSNGIPCIINTKSFKENHRKFIRLIQWFEPIIIAVFGTKDPLSSVNEKYSKASQRCAVSRYIGIGTYDTEAMPSGKIVTIPVEEIRGSQTDFWWYKVYHANSAYIPLKELGMDISYRKHYNHGVEIRFLDWFPEELLKGLLEFYICLADASLERNLSEEPIFSREWNHFLVTVLKEGAGMIMSSEMIHMYTSLLGIETTFSQGITIPQFYEEVSRILGKKYKDGMCNKLMR